MTELSDTNCEVQVGEDSAVKTVTGKIEDRVRAVQIINRIAIDRVSLWRAFSKQDLDAVNAYFIKGCAELAKISDADVQVVLAKLLDDWRYHTQSALNCVAWRRLLAEVEKSAH